MTFVLRLFAANMFLNWLWPLYGCTTIEDLYAFDQSHAVYDSLLETYVSDGMVDYPGLLARRELLQTYLSDLARVGEDEFNTFSENERLSFLINAYNAYTLELILQNFPVASITNIPGAWDENRWPLLDDQITLNQIEHELIRERFNEPRIHMALVCAAKGCPALRNEAYTPQKLEDQLDTASREFASDSTKNRLDMSRGLLAVSKIFEWYGDDFVIKWGETEVPVGSSKAPVQRAVVGFFREYLSSPEAEYLRQTPVRIEYLDYDWSLNGQPQ